MRFTVLFDTPYWIGLLEMERDGSLYVARHIFGAEPGDQEVYDFVQRDLLSLAAQMTVGLSIQLADGTSEVRHINPKRIQRQIRHTVAETGISSKAQEAMRLQIEANKQQHVSESKTEREAQRDYKRTIARAKAKAKHRGH